MAKVKELLADHLVNNKGESVEWDSVGGVGKTIGLYYSAHWCPPCRKFTPMLADFYNKLKPTDKGKDFDIVFVSSDSDEASFKDYFKDMPWLALKFDQRQTKVGNGEPTCFVCICYCILYKDSASFNITYK